MDREGEIRDKVERLVRMLATERAGGVLIKSRHNFSWLSAGGTNTVDTTREAGVTSLLVRDDGKCFALASRIEMPRLVAEEIPLTLFEPVEFSWQEEKANPSLFVERANDLLKGKPLCADTQCDEKTRVVEASIARCRYQLTEPEIERYRSLGHDAGEALAQLVRNLQPGITEQEVARLADAALAERGARNIVTLVAADERIKQFRHPVPTGKRWEKVLMVVICAERGGLVASLTRMVCAGELPGDLESRTLAAARVNAQMLSRTRPGAHAADLFETAARAYAAEGFPGEENLHHQGGATGYRTRDWVAHPACKEVVQTNQAFAWNPSITGTKVEDTCIAVTGAAELITSTPDWPKVSAKVDGREYLSPHVLSI
ncbi:MAG TPA: M24 family metallopeptidase [Pyrinomonadaceae bacterium]